MKVVKIICGLANQMFQYAFARALENQSNETVLYDICGFYNENQKSCEEQDFLHAPRKYLLDSFNISENLLANKQIFFEKKRSK